MEKTLKKNYIYITIIEALCSSETQHCKSTTLQLKSNTTKYRDRNRETPWTIYPARLLCPWDSPGKNTGVGCHFLFQGIFPA